VGFSECETESSVHLSLPVSVETETETTVKAAVVVAVFGSAVLGHVIYLRVEMLRCHITIVDVITSGSNNNY